MSGRADLVRLHGEDPIAFSTLQSGLRYCDASYGYIAYQRAWGIDITLGPPVAAPSDHATLIDRFLRTQRRPVFCYLRGDAAQQVLQVAALPPRRRMYAAGMGVDRLLRTRDLSSPGDSLPKPLRGARKHARRAGFFLQAVDPQDLRAADLDRLAQITRAYLQKSQLPYEMRFLNRPFAPHEVQPAQARARTYLLTQRPRSDQPPQVFGYAVLNPWFASGRPSPVGYLLDILRCEPTRQWGVYYAAVDALCQQLSTEGVADLSLGFCPLHQTQVEDPHEAGDTSLLPSTSPILSAQVAWLERQLAAVPYVQRLRDLKMSLPGRSCRRYFVGPSPLFVPAFVALMGACGVRLGSLLGPSLWQSALQARKDE